MKRSTTISLAEKTHRLGLVLAHENSRSFSGQIEALIREEALRRGLMMPKSPAMPRKQRKPTK